MVIIRAPVVLYIFCWSELLPYIIDMYGTIQIHSVEERSQVLSLSMLAESAVKQTCSTESSAVKQNCSTEITAVKQNCSTESSINQTSITESSVKQTCLSNTEIKKVPIGFSERNSVVTESAARVVTTIRQETSHIFTTSTNVTSVESRETSSVKSAEYNGLGQSPETPRDTPVANVSLRETSISPVARESLKYTSISPVIPVSLRETSISPPLISGSVSPPLRQTSTPVSDSGYCSTWANQGVKEPLKSGLDNFPTRAPKNESVGPEPEQTSYRVQTESPASPEVLSKSPILVQETSRPLSKFPVLQEGSRSLSKSPVLQSRSLVSPVLNETPRSPAGRSDSSESSSSSSHVTRSERRKFSKKWAWLSEDEDQDLGSEELNSIKSRMKFLQDNGSSISPSPSQSPEKSPGDQPEQPVTQRRGSLRVLEMARKFEVQKEDERPVPRVGSTKISIADRFTAKINFMKEQEQQKVTSLVEPSIDRVVTPTSGTPWATTGQGKVLTPELTEEPTENLFLSSSFPKQPPPKQPPPKVAPKPVIRSKPFLRFEDIIPPPPPPEESDETSDGNKGLLSGKMPLTAIVETNREEVETSNGTTEKEEKTEPALRTPIKQSDYHVASPIVGRVLLPDSNSSPPRPPRLDILVPQSDNPPHCITEKHNEELLEVPTDNNVHELSNSEKGSDLEIPIENNEYVHELSEGSDNVQELPNSEGSENGCVHELSDLELNLADCQSCSTESEESEHDLRLQFRQSVTLTDKLEEIKRSDASEFLVDPLEKALEAIERRKSSALLESIEGTVEAVDVTTESLIVKQTIVDLDECISPDPPILAHRTYSPATTLPLLETEESLETIGLKQDSCKTTRFVFVNAAVSSPTVEPLLATEDTEVDVETVPLITEDNTANMDHPELVEDHTEHHELEWDCYSVDSINSQQDQISIMSVVSYFGSETDLCNVEEVFCYEDHEDQHDKFSIQEEIHVFSDIEEDTFSDQDVISTAEEIHVLVRETVEVNCDNDDRKTSPGTEDTELCRGRSEDQELLLGDREVSPAEDQIVDREVSCEVSCEDNVSPILEDRNCLSEEESSVESSNCLSKGDNETSNATPLSAPNISVGEHWNNRDIAGDEKFVKEVSPIRQTSLESSLSSSSRQVESTRQLSVESSRQTSQPSSRQISQPSSRQVSLESAEFDNDGSLRKEDDVISHDVTSQGDVLKKSKEPRLYHYLVDEDATSYQITSFSATSDSMGSMEDLLQRKISSELTHITPRSYHTERGQELESMNLAGEEDGEEDDLVGKEDGEEEDDDEKSEDVSSTEVLMSIVSKTMPSKEPSDETSTPQQGHHSGDIEFERLYRETATALEMLSAAEEGEAFSATALEMQEGEAFSESFREATLSYSEKYHRLSFSDERQEVRPLNPSPPSKSLFTDSNKEQFIPHDNDDDDDEITRTRLSLVMSSSSTSHHVSTRVIGCSEYKSQTGCSLTQHVSHILNSKDILVNKSSSSSRSREEDQSPEPCNDDGDSDSDSSVSEASTIESDDGEVERDQSRPGSFIRPVYKHQSSKLVSLDGGELHQVRVKVDTRNEESVRLFEGLRKGPMIGNHGDGDSPTPEDPRISQMSVSDVTFLDAEDLEKLPDDNLLTDNSFQPKQRAPDNSFQPKQRAADNSFQPKQRAADQYDFLELSPKLHLHRSPSSVSGPYDQVAVTPGTTPTNITHHVKVIHSCSVGNSEEGDYEYLRMLGSPEVRMLGSPGIKPPPRVESLKKGSNNGGVTTSGGVPTLTLVEEEVLKITPAQIEVTKFSRKVSYQPLGPLVVDQSVDISSIQQFNRDLIAKEPEARTAKSGKSWKKGSFKGLIKKMKTPKSSSSPDFFEDDPDRPELDISGPIMVSSSVRTNNTEHLVTDAARSGCYSISTQKVVLNDTLSEVSECPEFSSTSNIDKVDRVNGFFLPNSSQKKVKFLDESELAVYNTQRLVFRKIDPTAPDPFSLPLQGSGGGRDRVNTLNSGTKSGGRDRVNSGTRSGIEKLAKAIKWPKKR
eukprot:sb/3479606/